MILNIKSEKDYISNMAKLAVFQDEMNWLEHHWQEKLAKPACVQINDDNTRTLWASPNRTIVNVHSNQTSQNFIKES